MKLTDACYRAYCDGELLKSDPVASTLVERDMMNIWIGKDLHIVQNTVIIGSKIESNWILTHIDTEDIDENWQQPALTRRRGRRR